MFLSTKQNVIRECVEIKGNVCSQLQYVLYGDVQETYVTKFDEKKIIAKVRRRKQIINIKPEIEKGP